MKTIRPSTRLRDCTRHRADPSRRTIGIRRHVSSSARRSSSLPAAPRNRHALPGRLGPGRSHLDENSRSEDGRPQPRSKSQSTDAVDLRGCRDRRAILTMPYPLCEHYGSMCSPITPASGFRAHGILRCPIPPEEATMTFLYLDSDQMGRGDEALGRKLMIAFLRQLHDSGAHVDAIGCVNHSVLLTTQDGPAAELLASFAARGTRVASCGTCLDHLGRARHSGLARSPTAQPGRRSALSGNPCAIPVGRFVFPLGARVASTRDAPRVIRLHSWVVLPCPIASHPSFSHPCSVSRPRTRPLPSGRPTRT